MKICQYCLGRGVKLSQRTFGREMRELRLAADVGLREFARMMKVTPAHICHLEKGHGRWTFRLEKAYRKLKPKQTHATDTNNG